MRRVIRWLVDGSDADTMPKAWMRDRLGEYVAYTARQLDQGRIVTDTAAMRRRQFWLSMDASKQPRASVSLFPQKVKRA